jgi:mono/diheme cytochrome c family protein
MRFLVLLVALTSAGAASGAPDAPLPARLRDTGLYVPGSASEVRAEHLAFSPQYPLWSDGTTKRRWLYLPPGTAIDARQPDAWVFPVGTRAWKEFSHGRPVETRFIERAADGSWRYAAYVWNADGTDAVLAPAAGVAALPVAGAPGGRYAIPSREDCVACHEGAAVPLLGFSALQLSPDRDPLAPHAAPARAGDVDLARLAARGLVRDLPQSLLIAPPRIAAPTPTARAALGYLHGNCGHCHNDTGPLAGLELALAQQTDAAADSAERTLASLVGQSSRFRTAGADAATRRVVPGRKEASVLTVRMRSANPLARMPPLGVQVIDDAGLALVERWIRNDLHQP